MDEVAARTEAILEQDDLPERATVGSYRLVQRLGEGGMGVVHLALDPQGRAVALKVLRSLIAADSEARARLRREVDALRRIDSARVAPIIDADIDGAHPFVVTRWVPGPALDDVVEDTGPLAGPALHRLAVGLAEGIEAIHAAGVVHRDIKPGNVLLFDGDPVLIDFGIAHLTDDVRLTSVGLVMGTPGYLAPEIVEGAQVGRATDWWGWAATLAYAASGRPPFGRGAMDAVLARVARGEPDLVGVDPRLAPLLLAALSPDAAQRPHQDEVVRALEHFARGGDVTDVIRVRPSPVATQVLDTPRTAVLPQAPPPAPATPGPTPVGRPPAMPAQVPAPPAGRVAAGPLPPPPVTSSPRPLVPARSVPAAPSVDPRIGRPMRSAVFGALLALGTVAAAVAPALMALAFVVLSASARTTDRAMTSLVLRRHERGERRGDLAMVTAAGPWHLLTGTLAALVAAAVPLLVAVTAVFSTSLILTGVLGATSPNSFLPLGVGGLFGLLMAWWGTGGSSLRRGSRSLVRGMTRDHAAYVALVVVVLLLTAVLVLWAVVRLDGPQWSPLADPSTWRLLS